MTRRAWFNCFSGISGDMALGALLDAGADVDEVRALVDRLPVDGWTLQAEPVLRCGLAGTKVQVGATETTVHRTAANILLTSVQAEAEAFSEQLPYYEENHGLFEQRLIAETMQRVLTNAVDVFYLSGRTPRIWLNRMPEKRKLKEGGTP